MDPRLLQVEVIELERHGILFQNPLGGLIDANGLLSVNLQSYSEVFPVGHVTHDFFSDLLNG
ncbi:hypothetical protein FRD01_07870 [Microvenator marinus]|uniref:Uncharacterized protein n=1 Tax=Microvenator marinus TaxID=2600177 RepID=A0A5B8XPJ1_9DELT|nr:hypothetical protein [Microvenator marinus]QED27161.1 hypothetical protein FRD01_07870 [Microvenator marinus]